MEWSLTLWIKGYITVKKVRDAEAKGSKSRTLSVFYTPKKNGRGSGSKFHTAFNAGAWNLKTLNFLVSANGLSRDQMQVIIDLSRDILKANDNCLDELENENNNDPRARLQERTFNDSEIESVCSDDEDMPGWDPIPGRELSRAPEPSSSTTGLSKSKPRV